MTRKAKPVGISRRDAYCEERHAPVLPASDAAEWQWVTGPTLRKALNISAVTLWRWRHNKSIGFPPAKRINSRLYFPWPDVLAWWDKQPAAR
jgi:hypothetical protein